MNETGIEKMKIANDKLNKELEFSNLIYQIKKECVETKSAEIWIKLTSLYARLEKLYDDLRINHNLDLKDKFFEVGDFIVANATRIPEQKSNSEEFEKQDNEIVEDNTRDDFDSLFKKLVELIGDDSKFDNLKSMIECIVEIDKLSFKIGKKINQDLDSDIITEEQYNNYANKMINLGFYKTSASIVDNINSEFKILIRLIGEKEDTKDLGETNTILKQFFDKFDSISEMIEEAKKNGIIIKKQEDLYTEVLNHYKQQILGGKRL